MTVENTDTYHVFSFNKSMEEKMKMILVKCILIDDVCYN